MASIEGIREYKNPKNGFLVLDVKYTADPRKRTPEWLAEARAGMPTAQWQREYGDLWTVYEGKPVYADFNPVVHEVHGPLVPPRRHRLISGWDAGPTDVSLAWVLGITSVGQRRVQIIDEYQVEDGDVEDFIQVIMSRVRIDWAKLGGRSLDIVDQSMFTPSGIERRSLVDYMRRHGLSPQPGEISFAKRRGVIENMLTSFSVVDASGKIIPDLTIHERCQFLREAMRGGYCYNKLRGGGEYKETPLKNKFSHIANAMEYLCSRLESVSIKVPYEGKPLPLESLV